MNKWTNLWTEARRIFTASPSRRPKERAPDKPNLEQLSDRDLDNLYWKQRQDDTEPRLREEERRLGNPEADSLSYYSLLERSIARYEESRRPGYLHKAERLGIRAAEQMPTDKLKWAVFDAEMRRSKIKALS